MPTDLAMPCTSSGEVSERTRSTSVPASPSSRLLRAWSRWLPRPGPGRRPGPPPRPRHHRCARRRPAVGRARMSRTRSTASGRDSGNDSSSAISTADAAGGLRGALADAVLEHPQASFLDGELDVADVAAVLLEAVGVGAQLGGQRGQAARRGRRWARWRGCQPRHPRPGLRRGCLRRAVLTGGGVAREEHARGRVGATVAEDHGLHDHDRGPEVGRDGLLLAIAPRTVAVPASEDRLHRGAKLLPRVGRDLARRRRCRGTSSRAAVDRRPRRRRRRTSRPGRRSSRR